MGGCGGCRNYARRVCRTNRSCCYKRREVSYTSCSYTSSGYTCYYCHCIIYGTRHVYPQNRHYYSCSDCVPDSWLQSCNKKRTSSSAAVPDAPLDENDYNTDVAHLQKILANLGYLDEDCVTSGFYCGYTAAAVRDFRYCYKLYCGDVYRYDSRTRDMLYRVVCSC